MNKSLNSIYIVSKLHFSDCIQVKLQNVQFLQISLNFKQLLMNTSFFTSYMSGFYTSFLKKRVLLIQSISFLTLTTENAFHKHDEFWNYHMSIFWLCICYVSVTLNKRNNLYQNCFMLHSFSDFHPLLFSFLSLSWTP